VRTSETNNNGSPATTEGLVSATVMQHIVYVHQANSAEYIYVDGARQSPGSRPGVYTNWNATYQFAIGNEPSLDRPFLGQLALVAVYCRALTQDEVSQNYGEGY
jgi:hypothetical protein